MSPLPSVTKDYLHTPPGDSSTHNIITNHAHNPFHTPHSSTTMTSLSHTAQPTITDPTDIPNTHPNSNPPRTHGYTPISLPDLRPQEIRIISHNINSLHTTTTAELGATFDSYNAFQPTILGLQETNKNWTLYDKTEAPLRTIVNRRWPGAKIATTHCKDEIFQTPYQPGGVAQFVLQQLTG